MSVELQRAASRIAAGLSSSPVMAQELYRLFLGANGRQRANVTLNDQGAPRAGIDAKLTGIDGAATLVRGDEVSTNRGAALVRAPRITYQGGQETRQVMRQEQERQPYLAMVVSKTSSEEYQCKILDKEPPMTRDAATNLNVPKNQTTHHTSEISGVADVPAEDQVTVQVYGDVDNFSYEAGDVINVQCVRHWKVRTTHQGVIRERKRTNVVSRKLVTEQFYHCRYDETGGGE